MLRSTGSIRSSSQSMAYFVMSASDSSLTFHAALVRETVQSSVVSSIFLLCSPKNVSRISPMSSFLRAAW